ncbi:MAG TPA: DUF2298 domain-containing protein [Patescibacteria group bacterium]|jgi:YYY domain-containing protein|nr:DUF2298 domain-containing protein [Patescibacteria group bacterium]
MLFSDVINVLKWFLVFLFIGTAFLPLTFSVFESLRDKGYIFSKIIGIAVISYFVFLIGTLRVLKFSEFSVILSVFIFFLINYGIFILKKKHLMPIFRENIKIFLLEEAIFLAGLFFWSYIRANNPDIHGLEKFMDFGFLNSILRSGYFPPKDMWYTPFPINYYFFGHLVTAVLTKLSFIPSFISYNLMLATLFALTFTTAFSIGMNLFEKSISYIKAVIAGLISALLVSLGGNLTTIYAFLKPYTPADSPVPFWQLPFLPFTFPNNYWYPNATRFIYHTIHEFPIYSFVVSDLHGHVLDIPFVLLTILFIFVLLKNKKISSWHLIFLAFLFAVMYMTNAWDGPIYFLLAFMLLFVSNFYKDHRWLFSQYSFYQLLKQFFIIFFGFIIFSLPFSVNFRPFVSGIGILCTPSFLTSIGKFGPFLFEVNHCQRTPFWQFTLLYGFFYFFVISFLLFLKFKRKYQFSKSDIFVLMLIVLSSILILVPEFIYVKDIYPTYYRANTMFKLVYEAFILLSLSCGYILVKLITGIRRKKILIPFSMASFVLLFLVLIYPVFAINSYYNNLQTKNKSLDGTAYLASLYPNDYRLIIWLNKNVHGQPVILEASGDSYTDYARISANTGLPTVIGWSVHEWLWRGTYDVVAPRIADVQILYTTHNITTARSLIKKYNISYVVVSDLERQKYPSINEQSFVKLGKLIFESDQTKLYKINF